MLKLTATITGRVVGVGYRAFVQDAATELGLVGYVKNTAAGAVLVLAVGAPDTLKELVEYLHEGSSLATVEGVAVEWGSVGLSDSYSDFSVVH